MMTISKYNHITWMDVTNPSEADIRDLVNNFNLDMTVAEQLLKQFVASKVEVHADYIYIVLRFPRYRDVETYNDQHTDFEVDFILTQTAVITVHQEVIAELLDVQKVVETGGITDSIAHDTHAGHLFIRIIEQFYETVHAQLHDTGDTLEDAEFHLFENNEYQMVKTLSHTGRKLIDLKRSISGQSVVLTQIRNKLSEWFNPSISDQLAVIDDQFRELERAIENYHSILRELRDTNDSLLSQKTTKALHTLTVVSLMVLPLTISIDALFAFDSVKQLPKIIMALAPALAIMIILALYFRKQKWI